MINQILWTQTATSPSQTFRTEVSPPVDMTPVMKERTWLIVFICLTLVAAVSLLVLILRDWSRYKPVRQKLKEWNSYYYEPLPKALRTSLFLLIANVSIIVYWLLNILQARNKDRISMFIAVIFLCCIPIGITSFIGGCCSIYGYRKNTDRKTLALILMILHAIILFVPINILFLC